MLRRGRARPTGAQGYDGYRPPTRAHARRIELLVFADGRARPMGILVVVLRRLARTKRRNRGLALVVGPLASGQT